MITWLNSLEPWQNIIVSIFLGLAILMSLTCFAALFFKWMDRKGEETQMVIPTEEELKRRRDENEKRAYKAMTRGKP